MLKIVSPLPEDLENLAQDVIGCCLAVHKELGPGLLERVYPRAVAIELKERGISFEMEKPLRARFGAEVSGHFAPDPCRASNQLSSANQLSAWPVDQLQRPIAEARDTADRVVKKVSSCVFVRFVPSWLLS
jgi:PD-(D/E)XK nuclease superfamily protein